MYIYCIILYIYLDAAGPASVGCMTQAQLSPLVRPKREQTTFGIRDYFSLGVVYSVNNWLLITNQVG